MVMKALEVLEANKDTQYGTSKTSTLHIRRSERKKRCCRRLIDFDYKPISTPIKERQV